MESPNKHPFDLEKRTTEFAKQVILLCRKLPRDAVNNRLISQVVGSSGSIGANYREANDALGIKDFVNRLRISRRETKETLHWLELISASEERRAPTSVEGMASERRRNKGSITQWNLYSNGKS